MAHADHRRPGDPNEAEWGKIPFGLRGGAGMWIPGSYDPDLNLFYIGTSQAKPWVPASRGMTVFDAALYTNSTLALNPQTGKMMWYFQHVPGEALDLDSVFERVLIDGGGGQKLLFAIGKDGILWKLDRRTGRLSRGEGNAVSECLRLDRSRRPVGCATGRTSRRRKSENGWRPARASTAATTGRRRRIVQKRTRSSFRSTRAVSR